MTKIQGSAHWLAKTNVQQIELEKRFETKEALDAQRHSELLERLVKLETLSGT
jgi:hypothetical protein